MTSFVKPNIDKTLYLWSENAEKVSVNTSTGGAVNSIALTNGVVNNITLTNGGYYTVAPTSVSLSGGGGSGATATIEISTALIKYPREVMTSATKTYTDGTVVRVSDSGVYLTRNSWKLFDSIVYTDDGQYTTANNYNATGDIGLIKETQSEKYFNSDTTYYGEYFIIDLGEKINLNNYIIYPSNGVSQRAPRDWRIYATNDDASYTNTNTKSGQWVLIDTETNISGWVDNTSKTFTLSPAITTKYRYYAMIVNRTQTNSDGHIQFSGLDLNGYPEGLAPYTVNSITLTNGGSLYETAPQVVINGGTATTPASASSTLSFSTLGITNGGSGYTSMPTVNFSGNGAGASATATGVVNNITLNNGGLYTVAPTSVSLLGGGGTGATATIGTTEVATKYPRQPFTSYTDVVNTNGTVVKIFASDTSTISNTEYWRLFDNNPATRWVSAGAYFIATALSIQTARFFNSDNSFYGEWVMIDLGESIILDYYKLAMANSLIATQGRTPQSFRIYATNDTTNSWTNTKSGNWVQIHEVNDTTIAFTGYTTFSVGSQTPYRYYAIIVNKVRGIGDFGGVLQITEWELYGFPATKNYGVNSITLTNGGSGYTTAPQIVFNGGTATTPATASSTLSVSTLAITNSGSLYTTAPTISFSGGGGTGATATTTTTPIIQGIERCLQYDWDIPDIILNQNGKVSLEGIVYKTFTPISTGTTTKIKNLGTPKYNYSSKKDDGVILDVSHWDYLKKKKKKCPAIPLTPQTINKISLSVKDSSDIKGVELTSDFVAVLKITEEEVPQAEWGNSRAINVRQMTTPTYNQK